MSMLRSRYRQIVFFFARIIGMVILWDLLLPRLGLRGWSRRTRSGRYRQAAVQFRALAIRLGGVMIKVGQFLSTRVDVLPVEVTAELADLQDEVAPEPFDAIQQVAEAELGAPLAEYFEEFDPTPLAAASLGQVHRARIRQADTSRFFESAPKSLDLVVKIQRPQIEAIINTDLAALRRVGGWLQRYPPISRRANVPALLAEFTRTLSEEIDYLAEGRNAEVFRENFKGFTWVRVPNVIWPLTTRRLLTLEDVGAIKITDYEAITAAGIDRSEVARRLLETYLKQIFEDGFFHADPHPGNLFVAPAESEMDGGRRDGWYLTFVDFGMVGRVQPKMRDGMREMLVGLGTQDPARMIKSYQMLGVLLPGADLERIEKAGEAMFSRFWGKNMTELMQVDMREMNEFAHQFRDLLYDLPFQIPQDIIFLGRCVSILSGMCTGLDAQFNVFEELQPFAQKLIKEELSGNGSAWWDVLVGWGSKLVVLPGRMDTLLSKIEHGNLAVHDPNLTGEMRRMAAATRRQTSAIMFAGLLLGGIQLLLAGYGVWGGVLIAGAVVSLGHHLFVPR